MTRDEAMKVWRDAVDAYDLAFCPGPSDAPNDAAATVIQQAFAERDGEIERLREAIGTRSETNDEGLLPCPKCCSVSGPHTYWWSRGQAWLVICAECKHEADAREGLECLARDKWNNEARQALAAKGDSRG